MAFLIIFGILFFFDSMFVEVRSADLIPMGKLSNNYNKNESKQKQRESS